MIVIATLLRKLQPVTNLVRPPPKKHLLRTPFDSQYVKGSQTNPCKIGMRPISSYSSISLIEPDLKNISLSDMLNLRDVL